MATKNLRRARSPKQRKDTRQMRLSEVKAEDLALISGGNQAMVASERATVAKLASERGTGAVNLG